MMNGKSKKVGYIAEQNSGNSPYSSSAMTEPVSNWELSRNHFQTHFQNQQHKQQQQQQSLSRPPPLDQMALRNKLALVEATQNKSGKLLWLDQALVEVTRLSFERLEQKWLNVNRTPRRPIS